jgi:competence protein ComFC
MQFASQSLCLIYPEVCQACCISLATPEEGFLCEGCQKGVEPVLPPFCSCCGRPSESQAVPLQWVCIDCSRRPYAFESARAAVHASPLMLGLIHQFKYQGALWMTPFFKQLMARCYEHDHEVMGCDGILPVPLHPLRKRERGYNQATILARMVCDLHCHQWLDGVLKRIAPNPSQTMLSRSMRFKNMAGAFEVQKPERIQGKKTSPDRRCVDLWSHGRRLRTSVSSSGCGLSDRSDFGVCCQAEIPCTRSRLPDFLLNKFFINL